MLPAPVSFSSRRPFRRLENGPAPRRKAIDILLTRARITNLGFLLLSTFSILSFLFNVSYYYVSTPRNLKDTLSPPGQPSSITKTFSRNPASELLRHLIVVPGHAVWKGVEHEHSSDEDRWVLEPYQKGGNRIATFNEHIARGVQLALDDQTSLLIFSGGQTRASSTTTEAESYMRLAVALNLFQAPSYQNTLFARATTEDFALDSYQNLLFSIARFHEYTGRYPEKITVVGYEMKRRRFVELHRAALRWPKQKFHYIGIDPPEGDAAGAREGELQNGLRPYQADIYGCHSTLLQKRKRRNIFRRFHSYHSSSPALRRLLDWCPGLSNGGATALFPGPLPWTENTLAI